MLRTLIVILLIVVGCGLKDDGESDNSANAVNRCPSACDKLETCGLMSSSGAQYCKDNCGSQSCAAYDSCVTATSCDDIRGGSCNSKKCQ